MIDSSKEAQDILRDVARAIESGEREEYCYRLVEEFAREYFGDGFSGFTVLKALGMGLDNVSPLPAFGEQNRCQLGLLKTILTAGRKSGQAERGLIFRV